MKIRIITLLILAHAVISWAKPANDNYYKIKVSKGENASLLFQKYLLNTHSCNLDIFLKINDLKNPEKLHAGSTYKIPVKIYDFDGKSIRSTLDINDYELAKKIENYNVQLLEKKIRKSHYKDSKILWVPEEFIACVSNLEAAQENEATSREKTGAGKKNEGLPNDMDAGATVLKNKGIKEIKVPLMGKRYEHVWIEDFSLENQVFYIISGHGGPDPGAMCTDCTETMCEDEYAYDVALRLARNLMQHGATVHMVVEDNDDGIRDGKYLSCDKDEKLLGEENIPISQKLRLRQRASAVNQLYNKYKKLGVKSQKAIEIHVDSRNSDQRQDVFFYYNKHAKGGKQLAENVQEVFEEKYGMHQKGRGYHGYVEDRNIYMVRNLLPTTLFVELANIRNAKDQERLIYHTNRQALANWLFEGLRKK
jgi:N-acetylmuramoyl-L-alanine amidase